MKRIVLVADDYGQAPEIAEAILALIQQGRLSATSCLVTAKHWPQYAKSLLPYAKQIDIGLHFNLTQGQALSVEYQAAYGQSFPSLSQVMLKAFFQRLNPEVIAAECRAQLEHFRACLGQEPDFIDGHQHVHQFPSIREALLSVYQQVFTSSKPYIRLVTPRLLTDFNLSTISKKCIILASGTYGMQKLLLKNQIPHNQSFAGIYAFPRAHHYPRYFKRFLQVIADQGLIMCHPGLPNRGIEPDEIALAREQEYKYLSSDQFLQDCQQSHIKLGRFQD
jgi:chitin disaccharide deacetylase